MLTTLTNFLVLTALTCATDADDGFKFKGIADNQVYFSKSPRFIKFDSKDDEVEIELGVSIPVVKIPLAPSVGRPGEKKESGITVSPPGLVIAGTLLLTTLLVVPLLFSKKTYRTEKSDDAEDIWNVMKQVEKRFYDQVLDSSSCMENLICWTAKAAGNKEEGTFGNWMDDVLRSKWMTRLANGTFVEKAILAGKSDVDCMEKYNNCPTLEKIYNLVKSRRKTKRKS